LRVPNRGPSRAGPRASGTLESRSTDETRAGRRALPGRHRPGWRGEGDAVASALAKARCTRACGGPDCRQLGDAAMAASGCTPSVARRCERRPDHSPGRPPVLLPAARHRACAALTDGAPECRSGRPLGGRRRRHRDRQIAFLLYAACATDTGVVGGEHGEADEVVDERLAPRGVATSSRVRGSMK